MGCWPSKEEESADGSRDEKVATSAVSNATSLMVGTTNTAGAISTAPPASAPTPATAPAPVPQNEHHHHRHHRRQSSTQPTDSVGLESLALPQKDEAYVTSEPTVDPETTKKGGSPWKEKAHHLKNIFAVPLDFGDSYNPPVHDRTDEEKAFIEKALKDNFLFENVSRRSTSALVRAFEKQKVKAGTTVITEGDEGDYFYIIESGTVEFSIKGEVVGTATVGASFGELALLYTCPRAATVVVSEDTTFFRVDQKAFRCILQSQTKDGEERKKKLLKDVKFLKDLSDFDMQKLAANMTPKQFKKGEVLGKRGDPVDFFCIVDDGEVSVDDIEVEDRKLHSFVCKRGDHFGQNAIVAGNRLFANIVAKTDGRCFRIDRETFKTAIGDVDKLMMRGLDKRVLSSIQMIKDTKLSSATIGSLAMFVREKTFSAGDDILKEGETTEAAVYLVRHGTVEITSKAEDVANRTVDSFGYFGQEMLLIDQIAGRNGPSDPTTVAAPYTAHAVEDCRVGVLSLENCRKVFDTVRIGQVDNTLHDSLFNQARPVSLKDLKKRTILGAGTFGQVWLVSRKTSDGKQRPYALKVQSKYELVKSGQAKAVVREKTIIAQLRHPFINSLVGSFQDETFVYMLMELVQGGELYSVMHTKRKGRMTEENAKFYAAGIFEALGFMHRRGFVYRDLKPENVLLRAEGYPVLIDFGFAKYVSSKTYTFCGTPLYLSPEVIMNRGHDAGADNWSLGILTYEMLVGTTPFYEKGMSQLELFRAIVEGIFVIPDGISEEAKSFLRGLIKRDPARRLGSLADWGFDIYHHEWFQSIDFRKLRRMEIPPPFVPKIRNPLDDSNFDDWSHLDDKFRMSFDRITPTEELIFENF